MPSDDALKRAESCEAVADRLLAVRGEPSFLREVFTAVIDRQRADAEQRGREEGQPQPGAVTRGRFLRDVGQFVASRTDAIKAEGARAERERLRKVPKVLLEMRDSADESCDKWLAAGADKAAAFQDGLAAAYRVSADAVTAALAAADVDRKGAP